MPICDRLCSCMWMISSFFGMKSSIFAVAPRRGSVDRNSGSNLPWVSGWMTAVTCTGHFDGFWIAPLLMRLRKVTYAAVLTCFRFWYGTIQVRLRRFCVHHSCLPMAMSTSVILVRLPLVGFLPAYGARDGARRVQRAPMLRAYRFDVRWFDPLHQNSDSPPGVPHGSSACA